MLGQWPARRLLFLDRFLDRRCTIGEAAASRSAWSLSKLSIANSSCSISRVSFSDDRPNSARL